MKDEMDKEFELHQQLVDARQRVNKTLAVRDRLTAPNLGMFEELRPVDGCSNELFTAICQEVEAAADAADEIERELLRLRNEREAAESPAIAERRIMT